MEAVEASRKEGVRQAVRQEDGGGRGKQEGRCQAGSKAGRRKAVEASRKEGVRQAVR
jgi:hypothetical protein